ncbi:hypothetical protein HYT23_06375 [Candidatus Pacearchaeota archaeon]|nr:hypothetical protein [Candidatus Pacearchaeota archaeon]
MDKEITDRFIKDLETATSIDFFEMRVKDLTMGGGFLPRNLDYLRSQTVRKNIKKLEMDIASSSQKDYSKMRQDQLDDIKIKYAHLLS